MDDGHGVTFAAGDRAALQGEGTAGDRDALRRFAEVELPDLKQRVIAPPVKKRYDREQLARLYCTCLLKHVFTISEIRSLMEIQTRTYPFPVAYDYFCTELEKALRATFSTRDFSEPSSAAKVTPESELVRSSALSIAHRLFTEKFLHFYDLSE